MKNIDKYTKQMEDIIINYDGTDHLMEKLKPILSALCDSIRAEALKEVEGIIGEDEPEKTNMLRSTGSPIIWDLALFRNQLRAEQRAVLAKLSKEVSNDL